MRNSSYIFIPICLKLYRHCDIENMPCSWDIFFRLIFQKLPHLESDVPVGGIVFHKHKMFYSLYFYFLNFCFILYVLLLLELPSNLVHILKLYTSY